jgi:hypothetical protein
MVKPGLFRVSLRCSFKFVTELRVGGNILTYRVVVVGCEGGGAEMEGFDLAAETGR